MSNQQRQPSFGVTYSLFSVSRTAIGISTATLLSLHESLWIKSACHGLSNYSFHSIAPICHWGGREKKFSGVSGGVTPFDWQHRTAPHGRHLVRRTHAHKLSRLTRYMRRDHRLPSGDGARSPSSNKMGAGLCNQCACVTYNDSKQRNSQSAVSSLNTIQLRVIAIVPTFCILTLFLHHGIEKVERTVVWKTA